MLPHISMLTACDNAGGIKERAWNERKCLCSKTTTVLLERAVQKV